MSPADTSKPAFLAWFKSIYGEIPFYDINPEGYDAYVRIRAHFWNRWKRGLAPWGGQLPRAAT